MDVLSDALAAVRTGAPHSSLTELAAPWGMRFAASEGAGFHVVLRGSCVLVPGEGEPVRLSAGDVVFLPHGRGHALADSPDTPLVDVVPGPGGRWEQVGEFPRGEGPRVLLLCGAYRLSRSRAHPLLSGLPEVVHLPARVGAHPRLRTVVDLLGEELGDPGPGSAAVVPALVDTLLLFILRTWSRERGGEGVTGWVAALADPGIAAALHAIHEDPARPWTVAGLGARAGMSRAVFARRFTGLVGRPPAAYLTWWRMTSAGRLLAEADLPIRVVAQRCGYSSEFAFAKAFKREFGVPPARHRRGSRKSPLTPQDREV